MYNPERICQYCQTFNHRTEECPNATYCNYCKREGHGIVRCKKVRCRRCGVKGHHQSLCEASQPQDQNIGWAPAPAPRPSTKSSGHDVKRRKTQPSSGSRNLNVTINSPEHNEEKWLEIKQDVRDDVSLQPCFNFPCLEALFKEMMNEIIRGLLPGSLPSYFNYAEAIRNHGGADKVTKDLIQWVTPNLRQIEGQEVTKSILDAIQVKQLNDDEPWNMPLGYAGIVSDNRDLLWWRLYVGQCSLAWRRVMCQHAQKILTGSIESLFYYVLWLGNGRRSAGFIKLWGCPEDVQIDDHWKAICNNFLEALFCRAFRTHFGMVSRSEEWQDGSRLPPDLGWGLNIMSPLVQGNQALTLELRSRANASLMHSPDSQILHWVSFHPSQRGLSKNRERGTAFKQPLLRRDFDNALRQALNNDSIFQQMKASFQLPQESSSLFSLMDIPFCGNLSAKVAVLLDYACVSQSQETPIEANNADDISALSIPWSLEQCGFSKANVLVWTYNFRAFASFGIDHLNPSISIESDVRQRHEALFAASQASILLLCGPQAARVTKDVLGAHLSEHTLTLRTFNYRLYYDSSRNRLLIRCPTLPAEIWSASTSHCIQISEILRFTLHFIPSLKDVRPFFLETSGIIGYILRQARRERLGGEPTKAEEIDAGVQLWLARRNLGAVEDVKKIEEIGGSLTRGLLMVTHCLPRRPKSERAGQTRLTRGATTKAEGRVRAHEHFDEKRLQEMRDFVGARIEDRNAQYRERLFQLAATEPQTEHSQAEQPQAEQAAVDSVASLRSFQDWRNQEPSGSEEMREFILLRRGLSDITPEEEADPSTLRALTADVIANGFLDPLERASVQLVTSGSAIESQSLTSLDPAKRDRKRQGTTHVLWNRVDIQNTEFGYRLKSHGGLWRQIYIYYCQLLFSHNLDIADGNIFVKVELYPPGESHPIPYATSSSDEYSDPAIRLGFRVRCKDSYGREMVCRPQTDSTAMAFKANSFVDILDGKSLVEISHFLRRYIYVGGESHAYPELERYKHGGYTSPHS